MIVVLTDGVTPWPDRGPDGCRVVVGLLESEDALLGAVPPRPDWVRTVNISSSIENAKNACKFAGIPRHSIAYSLGFEEVGDNTPGKQAIMLSTMCGHGMLSINFAQKMMSFVKLSD